MLVSFGLFDHFDATILNVVCLYAVIHEGEADLATFHITLTAICIHKCQVHDVSAFNACSTHTSNACLPLT